MADNVIKMQEEFIKKAEELSEKQASANKARFDHLLNTLEHMNPMSRIRSQRCLRNMYF